MKRTFHIPAENPVESDVLLCEFSLYHVSVGRADAQSGALKGLSYYELRTLLEPDKLRDVLRTEAADTQHSRTHISSGLKNVMLVPQSHFSDEAARRLFANTFGLSGDALFYNELPAYQTVVVHAVPRDIMGVLKSGRSHEAVHVFCSDLQATSPVQEPTLQVHFTGKEFQVLAIKSEQLQLAQQYLYTTPADVLYYLLAICNQYGFSQTETSVVLSGLVSADSAMYKELYQFFPNLSFWKAKASTALPGEYPAHFFSSLHNLAACVS